MITVSNEPIIIQIDDITVRFSTENPTVNNVNLPNCCNAFTVKQYQPESTVNCTFVSCPITIPPDGKPVIKINDSPYPYSVYKCSGGYIWQFLHSTIQADLDCRQIKICVSSPYDCEDVFYNIGTVLSFAFIGSGHIVLHSAVVEWQQGKGFLLCAPSGTGKSTQAGNWRSLENALIINGDRAICSKQGRKWRAAGSPWCGSSGEYINRSVKISCIILPRQSKYDYIAPLETFAAARKLMQRVFAPVWDTQTAEKAIDMVQSIAEDVPVFTMDCTPTANAVSALKKVISKI